MRKVLMLNLALLSACGGAELVAVETQGEEGQGGQAGQILNEAAIATIQDGAARLGLGRGDAVRQTARFTDELGQEHTRFERSYRGLPVRGGDFIVHGGQVVEDALTVSLEESIAFSPFASLGADAARAIGNASFKGVRSASPDAPQLVVYAFEGAEFLTLAWEVVTRGTGKDGTPSVLHTFVDANRGQVLSSYDEIETVSVTGKTLYAGDVTLEATKSGANYQLIDGLRGNHTTKHANGNIILSGSTTFGDNTSTNVNSAAADAHYGAAVTWDYYKTVHGRNGIGNDGKGATSVVHYGTNYANAFWSDGCFCMTYGDGDNSYLKPLVALDVAGHEMSHGVTSRTAKLVYSGESGGLNESTSDIFGTAVEFYANNATEKGDYLIGERIAGPSLGMPYLRTMISPSDDGGSVDHFSKYSRGMDVHYSSGIANNFFYLLSEGGTNKTSGKRVTGISRAKAEKIWYRALTTYFTSSTTFKKARIATLSAAKDLYGLTSTEYSAVATAWTAVGVI
jgi:Zn-dependent metalloprotease